MRSLTECCLYVLQIVKIRKPLNGWTEVPSSFPFPSSSPGVRSGQIECFFPHLVDHWLGRVRFPLDGMHIWAHGMVNDRFSNVYKVTVSRRSKGAGIFNWIGEVCLGDFLLWMIWILWPSHVRRVFVQCTVTIPKKTTTRQRCVVHCIVTWVCLLKYGKHKHGIILMQIGAYSFWECSFRIIAYSRSWSVLLSISLLDLGGLMHFGLQLLLYKYILASVE